MSLAMTPQECEAFLAEPRVAIISIPEEGRGPFSVPVWYIYRPGDEVHVWTSATSRKAKLIQKAGRISICVQKPMQPCRYHT